MEPAAPPQQELGSVPPQPSVQQLTSQSFLTHAIPQPAPAIVRSSAPSARNAPPVNVGGLPASAGVPALPHLQIPLQGSAMLGRPASMVPPSSVGSQPLGVAHQRPPITQHGPSPQFPPNMLPMLGYPLPLLQSVQNISAEELSKSTGIPLGLLQTQPQMQLAARQIMLQRIMAFQLQAQQAQQQQQQQQQQHQQHRPLMPQQLPQQKAAPPAVKTRPPAKAKPQPKQPKVAAAAQPRRQQVPAESDGVTGGGEVGGKVVWAKLGSYPWWPAKTLSESDPSFPPDADPPRPTSIPIRFFGTYDFCWIGSKRALVDWEEAYDAHVESCNQESFKQAVEEVQHFNKTGELPQVFYMRPPPEGRSRARGRRRARPRSGGGVGTPSGVDDVLATPSTGPSGVAKQRLDRHGTQDRAFLARGRRRRLLQKLGLAPPTDSPYSSDRIFPNPLLLKLQPEFDEQWPPVSRPLISTHAAAVNGQSQTHFIATSQPLVQKPAGMVAATPDAQDSVLPHQFPAVGRQYAIEKELSSTHHIDGKLMSQPLFGRQHQGVPSVTCPPQQLHESLADQNDYLQPQPPNFQGSADMTGVTQAAPQQQ